MFTLHYISDPMCSWCYAFSSVLNQIKSKYRNEFSIRYRLSGLASDTSDPMPNATKEYIQNQWRQITERTGIKFNWDFWTVCKPRRSTYNACRAVIAARMLDPECDHLIFESIQNAYYQRAMNPSDLSVLVQLASEIGLNEKTFLDRMQSDEVNIILNEDIHFKKSLNNPFFPSLFIEKDSHFFLVSNGYFEMDEVDVNIQSWKKDNETKS